MVFNEGNEELAIETQRKTELTEFFEMNKQNKELGEPDKVLPTLRYIDMPTKYTYNKAKKEWKPRAKDRKSDTLGRVDNVHPASGDRFYLRMLLNSDHCKGAVGFKDLLTVDKIVCNSYKDACQKRGMLQDDAEWELVLEEATVWMSTKGEHLQK